MEEKKYYKVVDINQHANEKLSTWRVIPIVCDYSPSKWTTAPLHSGVPTKLFVFDDLDDAKLYASSPSKRYEVWECQVENPTKHRARGVVHPLNIHSYWREYNLFKKKKKSISAFMTHCRNNKMLLSSVEAIMVDAVKLTKQIA